VSAAAGVKPVYYYRPGDFGITVTGRQPLVDFDQLIKDWHSNGGDQLKTEYEHAYAATQS
jgi:hypothetical protein